jgi:hypothetical protein
VDVLGPKGPARHTGAELLPWARQQLLIASQILDNPGGGLLFGTQAIGQVKAALSEADSDRWRELVQLLDEAEDLAVRRRFQTARELLERAGRALTEEEPAQA